MAKAQITTPEGINIKIEGMPEEILAVVKDLKKDQEKQAASVKARKGRASRVLLVDLISSLVDGGFFKKPRDLAAVKTALAEIGRHYPVTTLSGAMLRQVRKRNLRRIRENKRWLYTA